MEINSWQDVMIGSYGANWALRTYEKIDVFKMAEKIGLLKSIITDLKAERDDKGVRIKELDAMVNGALSVAVKQDNKVKELEQRLEEAENVIRFYADWGSNANNDELFIEDSYGYQEGFMGVNSWVHDQGKRAREYEKKYLEGK